MRYIIFVAFYLTLLATYVYPDDWKAYNKDNSQLTTNEIRTVLVDEKSIKWFGTDIGLFRFNGSEWLLFTTKDSLASNLVNDIAHENSDYGPELWLATDNGVSVVGINDVVTFATPYRENNIDLVSNIVQAVYVDSAHMRWFGTNTGVSAFTGNEWNTYTKYDYLLNHNDDILSIAGKNDWKYFGTRGGGVEYFQYDNNLDVITSATYYSTEWHNIVSDTVYAVFFDSNGKEWFGTDVGASCHWGFEPKKNWQSYTTQDGLVNNFVRTITEDSSGTLWFGTRGGISSYKNSIWTSYTTQDGLAGNIVNDIAVDPEGSLWIATNNGVSHFTGNITSVEQVKQMETFELDNIKVYPNPSNLSTTIDFNIKEKSNASLIIYNVLGNRVRGLLTDILTPGIHTLRWDGKDDFGMTVPTGIYFIQLITQQSMAVQKVIIMK